MDAIEARIECLRLAIDTSNPETATAEHVLESARAYADFVLGEKVIESASGLKKNQGRDDPK